MKVDSSKTEKILCLIIFSAGLFSRLLVAFSGNFSIHPDEIMQYLEQGHRVVFGYGIVPWEYISEARSWLVPGLIAAILYPFKLTGFDAPLVYVYGVKAVLCFISMSIPVCMYLYSRRLFSKEAALITFAAGCFWYELVVFAHKPLATMFAASVLMGFFAIRKRDPSDTETAISAFLVVFSVAIRLQLAPLAGFILLSMFFKQDKGHRKILVFSSLSTFLVIGLFDVLTSGGWWQSYINSIDYNLVKGLASGFGTEEIHYYFYMLLLATAGIFYVTLFISFLPSNIKRYRYLLSCIIIVIAAHSAIGHKEYRFISIVIPFWLMIISDLVSRKAENNKKKKKVILVIAFSLFLIVSISGVFNILPGQYKVLSSLGRESRQSFLESDFNFEAYLYLSKELKITGVLDLSSPWWYSGGYYYLHHKVPLYDTILYQRYLKDKPLACYVSHVIAGKQRAVVPGFKKIKTISQVSIWRRDPFTHRQVVWKNYIYAPLKEEKDSLFGEPVDEKYRIIFHQQ